MISTAIELTPSPRSVGALETAGVYELHRLDIVPPTFGANELIAEADGVGVAVR